MSFERTLNKYYQKTIFCGLKKPHSIPMQSKYDYFFIIPAYNEKLYIEETLHAISRQNESLLSNALVVIVINNSKDASSKIKQNNQDTYDKIINSSYNFEFIVIDCFSNKYSLPNKSAGVGLARKIGMDYCIDFSNTSSLFCSVDADTIISSDYLNIIVKKYKKKEFAAAVVNFKHQKNYNPIINKAIIEYENLLKEIALNIKKAGSIYGFVSMGSAIICSMKAYVAIGGMPPKKATEDFYFLQKLAKYQEIYIINDILVYPSSRAEQRIYLGTGFRMNNINSKSIFDDLYIDPNAYVDLKKLYNIIDSNWNQKSLEIMSSVVKNNSKLYRYLNANNFIEVFDSLQRNSLSKKQLLNQFHRWFDNFKIYKFLKSYD